MGFGVPHIVPALRESETHNCLDPFVFSFLTLTFQARSFFVFQLQLLAACPLDERVRDNLFSHC